MSEAVSQAWHDQAQRSLDAMHARAEKAESQRDELREEVGCLLEAIGWGGLLKIGYTGAVGDIEEFETSLHALAKLVDPASEQS